MIARVRELDIAVGVTHGLGRRPSRADLTPIDEAELAEFNRGTRKAIEANRDREARERHLDSLYFWREVTA